MIMIVVISKLCKKEQLSSYCLIFESVSSQIILDNFIQDFILIISLRVINNRELLFNYLNLADFLLKIKNNARISIHYNAFQKVKMIFNMLKKQLCKVCNCTIILDEYKQNIFHNMTYYD